MVRRRQTLAGTLLLLCALLLSAACSKPSNGRERGAETETPFTRRDGLYDAARPTDKVIVTVGKFGRVFRSENNGQTWVHVDAGRTRDLYSVAFSDDTTGVIVGSGGTYLRTADQGRTWQPQASLGTGELFKVVFGAQGHGFVVGAFGAVWRSDSAGKLWRRVKVSWETIIPEIWDAAGPVEPHLYDVVLRGNTVWIVGEYGLALRSDDGGATWARLHGGALEDSHLFAVAFMDAGRLVAAGQAGTVLYTDDDGAHWSEASLTEQDLYDVIFLHKAGTAVVTGDLGTTFFSPAGGRPGSWRVLQAKRDGPGAASPPLWLAKVLPRNNRQVLAFGASGIAPLPVPQGNGRGAD
ncbi:MAG: YCF48-related protein [Candidatus Binatia bacterium]